MNKYIDLIINYWFSSNTLDYDKWFLNSDKYDAEIIANFKDVLKEAEKGNLLEWLETKKGYIAHIILMGQLSRHIYRNTPMEYKNDYKTMLFMEMIYDRYIDSLSAIEKMFILMPYQYSENIDIQKKGCNILRKLIKNEVDLYQRNILKKALFYQKSAYDIIYKFGRFPKRNYILGRLSTEEEIDYMDSLDD
jgi:uncharacterized protein (DUF924 family)